MIMTATMPSSNAGASVSRRDRCVNLSIGFVIVSLVVSLNSWRQAGNCRTIVDPLRSLYHLPYQSDKRREARRSLNPARGRGGSPALIESEAAQR